MALPAQKDKFPLMVGVIGCVGAVTVIEEVVLHSPLVTVTVYVPAVKLLIEEVVAPLLQRYSTGVGTSIIGAYLNCTPCIKLKEPDGS